MGVAESVDMRAQCLYCRVRASAQQQQRASIAMAKKDKKGKKDKAVEVAADPGTVTITFAGLDDDAAATVRKFGDKKDIKYNEKEDKAGTGGPRGRPMADPHITADGKVLPTPNARNVSKAAAEYAKRFSADAKKTVLNHFGATAVSGSNGISDKHMAQALEIFSDDEEFQPPVSDKKKGKKDKKEKGKKEEVEVEEEVEEEEKPKKEKGKKGKDKKEKK